MFRRARATAASKWCSHLATSELCRILPRTRERGRGKPPKLHLPNVRFLSVCDTSSKTKPTTISLQEKANEGKTISMITAYDYTSARLADAAGFDILLVGDSLGMVQLGYTSTEKVTMSDMLHHCQAVSRTSSNAFLVGDMPFGSYLNVNDAVNNACTLIKTGGMDAVKMEGGRRVASHIAASVDAGIPVMGHIGLTPQTATQLGGYKVQGRTAEAALALYEDAKILEEAGCFSVVLECVPEKVACVITENLNIPTIGIGAGRYTNGQVQVFHDVIGLYDRLQPKFSKRYANTAQTIRDALALHREDIEGCVFPDSSHCFKIKRNEFDSFCDMVSQLSIDHW